MCSDGCSGRRGAFRCECLSRFRALCLCFHRSGTWGLKPVCTRCPDTQMQLLPWDARLQNHRLSRVRCVLRPSLSSHCTVVRVYAVAPRPLIQMPCSPCLRCRSPTPHSDALRSAPALSLPSLSCSSVFLYLVNGIWSLGLQGFFLVLFMYHRMC